MTERSSKAKFEVTLVLLPPVWLSAGRTGVQLDWFEKAGLRLVAVKMVALGNLQLTHFFAERLHEDELAQRLERLSDQPLLVLALHGAAAVSYGCEWLALYRSEAVYASPSAAEAARDLAFFFKPRELFFNP
ncbi:MAG: hypothetical protein HQL49_08890 [Gammaproteobacteria bacterium]|nr:hypothetical protein [Gammaproteobacteria bacterium]